MEQFTKGPSIEHLPQATRDGMQEHLPHDVDQGRSPVRLAVYVVPGDSHGYTIDRESTATKQDSRDIFGHIFADSADPISTC